MIPLSSAYTRTFTKAQAMGYGVLCALPFLLLIGLGFRFFLSDQAQLMALGGVQFYLTFIILIAISVTLHELLHGIGWMLAGHLRWKDIHFHFSAMMPTTCCEPPLAKRAYLVGVLLPFVVLGLGSSLLLLTHPATLTLLAALVNITLAGADLAIAIRIAREPASARISDHPTLAGYVVNLEK